MPSHLPRVTKSLRVLCADDHHSVREVLARLLKRAGHTCDVVADGADVLGAIAAATAKFDVIVTDHEMPGVNGLALVKALRAAAFPGRIVVHASPLDARTQAAYVALGVDDIIAKPIGGVALLRAIEAAGDEPDAG